MEDDYVVMAEDPSGGGKKEETTTPEAGLFSMKELTLIMIDCSKKMFEPIVAQRKQNEEGVVSTCAFAIALQVTKDILRQKIKTSQKDLVGVYFYGVKNKDNYFGQPNVNELFALDIPDAHRVNMLTTMLEKFETPGDNSLQERLGLLTGAKKPEEEAANNAIYNNRLEKAFWVAQGTFQLKKTGPNDVKQVYVLSNDEEVFTASSDVSVKPRTYQRMRDLAMASVSVILWAVGKTRKEFDLQKTWKDLFAEQYNFNPSVAKPEDYSPAPSTGSSFVSQSQASADFVAEDMRAYALENFNAVSDDKSPLDTDELLRIVKRQDNANRKYATLSISLGFGAEIGVSAYITVKEAKIPPPIKLQQSTTKPLKSETKYMDASGGEVYRHEIFQVAKYGATQCLRVEQDEMNKLKQFPTKFCLDAGGRVVVGVSPEPVPVGGERESVIDPNREALIFSPSVVVLCFRPLEEVPLWSSKGSSYFLRPSDVEVANSTGALLALIGSMTDKKVCALCTAVLRAGGSPSLAVMIAQKEKLTPDKVVVQPAGMTLCLVAYSDDVRRLRLAEDSKPTRAQIDAAKEYVENIPLANEEEPLNPAQFENPALQRHFAQLEALALNKAAEPVQDLLLPADDFTFEPHLKDLQDRFSESFGGAGVVPVKPAAAKRSAADGSSSRATKAARVEPSSNEDWAQFAKDKAKMSGLTAAAMKDFLKANNLPVSGVKDVLMDRIIKFFDGTD